MTLVLEGPWQVGEDGLVLGAVALRTTVPSERSLERLLVERAQRGDEEAFHELATLVGDRLFGLAYHVLRDPGAAEDAAQQALLDIWRQLPRLSDPDRFAAWSYRIVVRAAYAEVARRRKWLFGSFRAADPPAADHASSVVDRDQLERGFSRLSVEQRAVLALRYFADRTQEEIADILDLPVGTVRSRLHYGLQRLRAELEADARSEPGQVIS